MDQIWQLTGGVLMGLSAIAVLELASARWRAVGEWLRGRPRRNRPRPREPRDRPQRPRPPRDTPRATRHAPPVCPHCEGRGRVLHVIHCSCGCGDAATARDLCPLCGGIGAVPARIARGYDPARWMAELVRWRVVAGRN